MRRNSALITRPARERIKRELFMILHGPAQEQSLRELLACGLLERLLPDILLMSGVRQSPPMSMSCWNIACVPYGFWRKSSGCRMPVSTVYVQR